jgi:predicted SnoaL-like aldol condensation-catalyzing enzyme
MARSWLHFLAATAVLLCGAGASASAQEPVVGAADSNALFHSSDPKLDANKQVAYYILKDILEAGSIEAVDRYLTERYIQHNPNIPSGREELKKSLGMRESKPISSRLAARVVSVVAEGDFVIVCVVHQLPDPKGSDRTYTTTHFDMWRMQDGKADEHWDAALLGPPPGPPPSAL